MATTFPLGPVLQRPGFSAATFSAGYRIVMRNGRPVYYPGGGVINGTLSRDLLNGSTWQYLLRPGLLMGKITATGYWAPSVIGTTTVAYTSGGTTLNIAAAQAAELVRRVGASGTFKTTGPPSAAGTVAVTTTTYSAVNTTTGDITVTSLGVNKVTNSLIQPTDGSDTILSFIPDGIGLLIDDVNPTDINFPEIPIGCSLGCVVTKSQLLPWPADASSRLYIKAALQASGDFVFDDY